MKHSSIVVALIAVLATIGGCRSTKPGDGFLPSGEKPAVIQRGSISVLLPKDPQPDPGGGDEQVSYDAYELVNPPNAPTSLYVGPNPGATTPADWDLQPAQSGDPKFEIRLNEGWILFRGYWPMAHTPIIVAGTVGTSFIVQVDDDGYHRAYLIDKGVFSDDAIKVWEVDDESVSIMLNQNNTFIEVKSGGELANAPVQAINGSDQEDFVDFVLAIEKALKLP